MPGATAIGITCGDGIVLAAEKRVSYGNFVVNKNTKKVFAITHNVAAACAGMVADMQVLVRQVTALSRIRKLEIRRDVATNSIAKLMSVIMFERRYFPLLTQVVVGGTDPSPQIYTLDPLGSLLPDDYAAVGTGAEMALGVLDSEYKKDISIEVARNLAVKAIKSSIQRDSASGDGIDLVIITDKGIQEDTIKL
ncbi:MAG: archaeal proteasome endopeptidase complex subunit beta [Nitrososphaeraceae archaeon]|jgi:proteasome beta subunit|nr:archaeal proteasome endopeptidase complex subunit beta [Nitrososphaeraceae archaeon]